MEVTVQPEREDYFSFNKYIFFSESIARRISAIFIISLFLEILLQTIGLTGLGIFLNIVIYVLLLAAISSILLFTPYLIAISKLKKRLAIDNKPIEERKIKLTEAGIEITSVNGDIQLLKYQSLNRMGINNDCIYFGFFGNKHYIIPIRSFSTGIDAANFYGFMRQEWARVNPASNIKPNSIAQVVPKTPSYLYFLGLLGLIPIIGGIVGIVLVSLGIILYRNKILSLIGSACVLFTVIICSFLFLATNLNKNILNNSRKEIASSQLNELVKSIEFYKMQNGVYPDSLQEIRKDNTFEFIYDPMGAKRGKRGIPYQYWKIGNKYTLFSVGVDGIPLTDDDIYPAIGMNDTAKFGLIKAR